MKVWVVMANTPSVWSTERRAAIEVEWWSRHGEVVQAIELTVNPSDLESEDDDESPD